MNLNFYLIIGVLILQYNLFRVFFEHSFCGGQPKKELMDRFSVNVYQYQLNENGRKSVLTAGFMTS